MAITAGVPKVALEYMQKIVDSYEYDERGYVIGKKILVKKCEPRMFMGKEVPEGATHYLVDQNGNYSWLAYLERDTYNPSFYQDGFWYGLPYDAEVRGPIHKLPKQESQKSTEMKELTLQDLDDGVIVVMPDNSKYQVRRTNLVLDVSEWSGVLDRLHIALEGRPQPIIREQEKNIMKKDFTKADLRSGHKVVFRSGETFVVFLNVQDKNSNVLSGEESWLDFSHINDDLTATFSTDCDIVEVWNNPVYDLTSDRKYNLVWKREEKSPEQLAYEQLQAQIADEEARHNESMKALREQAEKLKPKQ